MAAGANAIHPGLQTGATRPTGVRTGARPEAPKGPSFADELDAKLRISGHAARRLESRGVALDSPAMDRLSTAVDQASERGSRETLILMDGVAFVVSVDNRTVITAHNGAGDRMYTNIDSTIVLGLDD